MARFFSLIFLLFFSSCMMGPKKEVPAIDLPTTYIELQQSENPTKPLASLTHWWQQFEDKVLDELINVCLEKNFDIRTASEQIDKARASLTSASSKLLPFVNFFGVPGKVNLADAAAPQIPGTSSSLFSSLRSIFVLGFDAGWEIDFFGKNRSKKEEAFFNWQASEENFRFLQISLIAEIARLYTEIRGLQERIKITNKRITVYENLLYLMGVLQESGLEGTIPLQETLASFAAIKGLLPGLQKALDLSLVSLSFLLGGDLSFCKKKLSSEGSLPHPFGKVPIGLPSELIEKRPDIREAKSRLFASGAALGAAKADLLPSFALTGFIGNAAKAAGKLFHSGSRFWAIFPDFDWSLFEGGNTLARISIATIEQKQAAIAYEKTVYNALKEVENSLIQYRESASKTEDLLLEYKAKKGVLISSENLFSSGLSSLYQLLESYDQVFSVQINYIETKESTMLGLISLYKSLGGGL